VLKPRGCVELIEVGNASEDRYQLSCLYQSRTNSIALNGIVQVTPAVGQQSKDDLSVLGNPTLMCRESGLTDPFYGCVIVTCDLVQRVWSYFCAHFSSPKVKRNRSAKGRSAC
jgi:hypothetical protein